jgi:quercetin dioxygenase-like cupin family protein
MKNDRQAKDGADRPAAEIDDRLARYTPSPRPDFDRPTAILRTDVTRHIWGDETTGYVADLIYASTRSIHALVFELPANGRFTHSEEYRTVFGADELLHVLEGTMVIANPETGEVWRVRERESVFFRKNTWHHAFAHGGQALKVLEIFAPPPAAGASGAYSRTRPYLSQPRYHDPEQGTLPPPPDARPARRTMHVLRDTDVVWRRDLGVLEGMLASTEQLSVHLVELNSGDAAAIHAHRGDEIFYVRKGSIWVRSWHGRDIFVFELGPGDACLVPEGAEHEYRNYETETAEAIVGVAPHYLP